MAITRAAGFLRLVLMLWCSTQGVRASGLDCKVVKKTAGKVFDTVRTVCSTGLKAKRVSPVRGPTFSMSTSTAPTLPTKRPSKSAAPKPTCSNSSKVCFEYLTDDAYAVTVSTIKKQVVSPVADKYGGLSYCLMWVIAQYKNCVPGPFTFCVVEIYNLNLAGTALTRAQVCQGFELSSLRFVSPGVVKPCQIAAVPAVKAVAPVRNCTTPTKCVTMQKCTTVTQCVVKFPKLYLGYSYDCKGSYDETFFGLACSYTDVNYYVKTLHCVVNVVRSAACANATRITKVRFAKNVAGTESLLVTTCTNP